MKHLSLFTGYGGFDIATQACGIESVGFSEIEPKACALLRYKFPHIKNYGDITKINTDDLPDFDLLTGGFPCQSYSIAGKRGGLEDLRGQLIYDVFRILRAKKPKWFVLENVKGLLNHDGGKSAGLIFTLLRESGYAVDERVMNTKEFGIPQNRERVFIVGLREDLCGTLPDFWHFDFPIPPKTPCRLSDILEDEVDEKYYLSEKAIKRLLNPKGGFHSKINPEIGSTVFASQGKIARGMDLVQLNNPTHSNDRVYSDNGVSPTLNTMQGGNRQPKIAIPVLTPDRPEKRQNGRRFKDDGEPSFTLTAQDRHGVMIAEATKQGYAIAEEGDSINLSVPNSATRRGRVGKGVAQTLDTGMQQYTLANARIRRLVPVETARLQGLDDDWLDYGINEKGETYRLSDSAKYKLAGNGVSVPVVQAIINQII